MTELNDAVDALTLGQSRRQPQDVIETYEVEDEDGVKTEHQRVIGSQKITVTLPALLEQLDEAIRSSMGGNTPGAKLASEGSVLNVSALYEAMKIESQVGDWCRMVGVRPSKDTAQDLRAWHAAILSKNLEDARESWYVTTLNTWAHTIRNLLDPWREMDLPDKCPICGASSWWDKATGTEFLRPLIIKYRPEGADMVQQSRAMCRACEQVWTVRELAYELEQSVQSETG